LLLLCLSLGCVYWFVFVLIFALRAVGFALHESVFVEFPSRFSVLFLECSSVFFCCLILFSVCLCQVDCCSVVFFSSIDLFLCFWGFVLVGVFGFFLFSVLLLDVFLPIACFPLSFS